MENIYTLTVQNNIDAEREDCRERVEGGILDGGARIEKDGLVLNISNLGTEDEDGNFTIEGYQSSRHYADEPQDIFGEDFSESEAEVLALIRDFLA